MKQKDAIEQVSGQPREAAVREGNSASLVPIAYAATLCTPQEQLHGGDLLCPATKERSSPIDETAAETERKELH